jgi:hypothetical protein
MKEDTAIHIYRWSVAFATLGALLVPITYQVYSKGEWRRHAYGRHLMGSDTVLASILVFYFIAAVVDYPVAERIIGAILMVTFGWLRFQRTRFMRKSTQSTGYDNKNAVYGENEKDHR